MSEEEFEEHIVNALKEGGYRERFNENYNKNLALDEDLFLEFVKDSQFDQWNELQNLFGSDPGEEILNSLSDSLNKKGTIWTVRNGFKVSGNPLDCFFRKPVSKKNPDIAKLYEKNILSVIRQVRYSNYEKSSVDIVLFLNGILIATAELKNSLSNKTFRDAIDQYKEDRDPNEILFSFKKRALVHFAVDEYQVHMTTKLEKENTQFLPFNKGKDDGAGNPPNKPYETSYLWEDIWKRESWLDIIENYLEIDQPHLIKDPTNKKDVVIFPRYHQLRVVRRLISDTHENGRGQKYLIEHAPGGGKSNSIAWLAYKLYSLHDQNDESLFDSVIVISDRLVITGQLSRTIKQFENTAGLVKYPDKTKKLTKLLENKRGIYISTQQKFHTVREEIEDIKGKNFAILIDEAQSSQGGISSQNVLDVFASTENQTVSILEEIENSIQERKVPKNLSYFAFTATPRYRTLELFGKKNDKGKFEAFDLYSMKQAIEEGFILDVLKNYITYRRFFEVSLKGDDRLVDGKKATRSIMNLVDESDLNISRKVEIIVEHFRKNSRPQLGGNAKAMVVAGKRELAVKYKKGIDRYIKNKNYTNIRTLVAFSGYVKNEETGKKETEISLNNLEKNETIDSKFDTPEFNILITAAKFQAGFNQPFLHSMYVDTKLEKVHAVQTLSRLNRKIPGKTDPIVLDFVNDPQEIKEAFQRYYKATILSDNTDPNYLVKLYKQILDYNIILEENLDSYWNLYESYRMTGSRPSHTELIMDVEDSRVRYLEAEQTIQGEFQNHLINFVENYVFFNQILIFDDPKYEKLYRFGRSLLYVLPEQNLTTNPIFKDEIAIKYLEFEKEFEDTLGLEDKTSQVSTQIRVGKSKEPYEATKLSKILQKISRKYQKREPTIPEQIAHDTLILNLSNDLKLISKFSKNNSLQELQNDDDFNNRFDDELDDLYPQVPAFIRDLKNDPSRYTEYKNEVANQLFELAQNLENEIPPIRPDTRLKNRQSLRRVIKNCKDYLYWDDPFFNIECFDFLEDLLENKSLKEIRMLGSIHRTGINTEFLEQFKKIKHEMNERGISLSFRIETSDENREFHNRYVIGSNYLYDVPSVTELNRGRSAPFSRHEPNSVTYKSISSDYEKWWNSPTAVDMVKKWEIIQKAVEDFSERMKKIPTTCQKCGKEILVPAIIIKKKITPYCPVCNPKYK